MYIEKDVPEFLSIIRPCFHRLLIYASILRYHCKLGLSCFQVVCGAFLFEQGWSGFVEVAISNLFEKEWVHGIEEYLLKGCYWFTIQGRMEVKNTAQTCH